jgi:hypothetical protein
MSPIITIEDEITLVKNEKLLAAQLKKLARWQKTMGSSQNKFAADIVKMNIERQKLNRIFRDVFNQMQTIGREDNSNVGEEEVSMFQEIIHANDNYIEANNNYMTAIKDLAIRKQDLAARIEIFANSLSELAARRSVVIKKALGLEKSKDKLIESGKLTSLENQLTDSQREFDRARNIMLKEIEQFLQVRKELNELWISLKDSISEMS